MRVELVTTLKRHATRILKEARQAGEPILITEHGLPSAYIVDAESFERERERTRLLEGLARGEQAVREGRVLSQKKAMERLSQWLR